MGAKESTDSEGYNRRQTQIQCVALLKYAVRGNLAGVKSQMKQGAYIDHANPSGLTALMTAAKFGEEAIVSYLIQQKADVNKSDRDGNTALSLACMEGRANVVRHLVSGGACLKSAHLEGGRQGPSPIVQAAEAGSLEIVEFLVKSGADVEAHRNQVKP